MTLSTTAQRALATYGGEARWRSAGAVEAAISSGGLAFLSKGRRGFRQLRAAVTIAEPRVEMRPAEWHGAAGFLDGRDVRIEDARGQVVASRSEAQTKFPYGRRLLWWDRLDLVYFGGYALWNYLTLPALLLREDIEWTEVSPGTLEARFPPHLPTHCEYQRFHFDRETGLLRQHDYTAEVFGGWAKAAHLVLAHGSWDGVPFPSRRRVTPRRPDGRPWPLPVLVWIEVHDWRLR